MKYMLDTNICIYIIKKRPSRMFKIFESLEIGEAGISSITLAEMEYGVYKSKVPEKNKLALLKFLTPLTMLPFDDKAANAFGIIRAKLEKRGQPIGPYDLLIAAHAYAYRLTLVTNNTREFKRIKNLKIASW